MKRMLVAGALALAVCATSAASAEAALVLRLTEGATTVTIEDGSLQDSNLAAGAVTYIGAVGVFNINVSTGLSKPVLPASPSVASMDLNSVNTSAAPGTLVIELTDTDFPATNGPGQLVGAVGGTTDGTISFDAYKNDSNVEFDTLNAEGEVHIGPFVDPPGGPATAFSGTDSDGHAQIGAYSMTMVATITHGTGVNVSSFDFEVHNIPEPASLALFGIGLLGAGMAARRRKANRS